MSSLRSAARRSALKRYRQAGALPLISIPIQFTFTKAYVHAVRLEVVLSRLHVTVEPSGIWRAYANALLATLGGATGPRQSPVHGLPLARLPRHSSVSALFLSSLVVGALSELKSGFGWAVLGRDTTYLGKELRLQRK